MYIQIPIRDADNCWPHWTYNNKAQFLKVQQKTKTAFVADPVTSNYFDHLGPSIP